MKKLLLMTALTSLQVFALELAPIFSDNAVLQRGKSVPIWGSADAGKEVSVKFAGQNVKTKANSQGQWKLKLKALKASNKAAEMLIKSGNDSLSLKNLLVGEVWYAAGQSNMRWQVSQSSDKNTMLQKANNKLIRFYDLHAKKDFYPNGRAFPLTKLSSMTADNYYQKTSWKISSSKTAPTMSAVAYSFAQDLQKNLKVPVGIIHTAVGGVPTESFISYDKMKSNKELKDLTKDWINSKKVGTWCQGRARHNLSAWIKANPKSKNYPNHPFKPGFLAEAGVKPIAPYAIKGALWYQGESNAPDRRGSSGKDYVNGFDLELSRIKLQALIEDWRTQWKNKKLPFLFVQLPGMNRPWAPYREMQRRMLSQVKGTGMAVTYDQGHPTDVHPRNKAVVGQRLSLVAQKKVYKKKINWTGPLYKSHKVQSGKIILSFKKSSLYKSALATINKEKKIMGFEIAGSNGKFVAAQAKIKGKDVIVSSQEVRSPKYVRYAWFNDPKQLANLGNKAGLPASPFTTQKDLLK